MQSGIRSFVSWICIYLVGTFWFLSASAFALFAVLNEETIKDALKTNNTYGQIVPAVLDSAEYPADSAEQVQLPLNEPWVQDAAKKAFPEDDLHGKGDAALNGTFAWLAGETEKPSFELDFSKNKEQLGQELGNASADRIAGLPPCSLANLPEPPINLATLKCQPPGIGLNFVRNIVASEVRSDQGFLKDPVITADDLRAQEGGANLFDQLESLRGVYQLKPWLLWGLPALVLLFAVTGIMCASNRARALKRLARISLLSGIGFVLITVVLWLGVRNLSSPQGDKLSNEVLLPVTRTLAEEAQQIYIIFALISLLVAGVLFIYLRRLRQNF